MSPHSCPSPNTRLDDLVFVVFRSRGNTHSIYSNTHTNTRTQREAVEKGCSGLFSFFKHVTAPRQRRRDKEQLAGGREVEGEEGRKEGRKEEREGGEEKKGGGGTHSGGEGGEACAGRLGGEGGVTTCTSGPFITWGDGKPKLPLTWAPPTS